jgi:hypothetical protein
MIVASFGRFIEFAGTLDFPPESLEDLILPVVKKLSHRRSCRAHGFSIRGISPHCPYPRQGSRRPREKVAMINPATFVLMVIIGTSPPQQRGEFHSYHQCYEAAQGEVAHLGPDVRWDCVPKSSVEGPAPP